MKKFRLNQEDINDLIAHKAFNDREELFDALEVVLDEGFIVCFYSSYIINEDYPTIVLTILRNSKNGEKVN